MAGRLQALVGTREQLLRTIAHELRSPLARLQLAVELARRRTNGWTCSWTASNARANGSTRWAIRWRWRRWAPCPSRPTCSTWPKSWTPWSRTRALKRATATSASPGNDPPLRIQGDRESLASAIENVLRCASRRRAAASACVCWRACATMQWKSRIAARVPEQELGYLFEPFYRSASGAAMAGSGAGLGLSIARAAVAAHKAASRPAMCCLRD